MASGDKKEEVVYIEQIGFEKEEARENETAASAEPKAEARLQSFFLLVWEFA